MIHKLALGTVQFGLNYGINNTTGIVPKESIDDILKLCKTNEINFIDTAQAYGISEMILGNSDLSAFNVISKLPDCSKSEIQSNLNASLNLLKIDALYGYLLHNFSTYTNDNSIWQEFLKLKLEGKVRKIGFSLYSPSELEEILINGVEFDLIQIPYNIFDRRFEPYFNELKEKNIEIHTRSAFLQGLFFKPLNSLPDHFELSKPKLGKLNEICENLKISKVQLCLGFALSNKNIDQVVIGIDSIDQLSSNISEINNMPKIDYSLFDEMKESDLSIINPSLW